MSVVVVRLKQRARTLVEVDWNLPILVRRKTIHIASIQATTKSMANNNEASTFRGNIAGTEFPTPEKIPRQESLDQDEYNRCEIHELIQTLPRRVPPQHPPTHNYATETGPCASNCKQNALISPFLRDETLDAEQIIAHGTEWYKEKVSVPIGGRIALRAWNVKTIAGANTTENAFVTERKIIDCFMIMFPLEHLGVILCLTKVAYVRRRKQRLQRGKY